MVLNVELDFRCPVRDVGLFLVFLVAGFLERLSVEAQLVFYYQEPLKECPPLVIATVLPFLSSPSYRSAFLLTSSASSFPFSCLPSSVVHEPADSPC